MDEQEQAHEIIHWIKDELKCLYMVSELKRELKDINLRTAKKWQLLLRICWTHFSLSLFINCQRKMLNFGVYGKIFIQVGDE